MNIETIREFLGWCTVINSGFLALALVKLLFIRDWASRVHAKMFGLDDGSVREAYFRFAVYYIIAIIVFNLVPYIALAMMSGS
jgi:Family of unknown function (DUF6868)